MIACGSCYTQVVKASKELSQPPSLQLPASPVPESGSEIVGAGGLQRSLLSRLLGAGSRSKIRHACPLAQPEDQALICAFGKPLLTVCRGSDIDILKERTPGERSGCFTRRTSNGESVVRYFLASSYMLNLSIGKPMCRGSHPQSDHCLVTSALNSLTQNAPGAAPTPQDQNVGSDASSQQIKYHVDKVEIFREALGNLLDPVFGVADPSFALLEFCRQVFSQDALATSDHPSQHKCYKTSQKRYDDAEG